VIFQQASGILMKDCLQTSKRVTIIGENLGVSYITLSLSIEFKVTTSSLMQAMASTFLGFPTASNR
jgi:hypothetical protein